MYRANAPKALMLRIGSVMYGVADSFVAVGRDWLVNE